MSDKLLDLHEKCKKLNSSELIGLCAALSLTKPDEKLIKIMKTYLSRALIKEGIL